MKFSKEYLRALLCGNIDEKECKIIEDTKECRLIENKIKNKSRWFIKHSFLFEKDGKFYRTGYSVGIDQRPFAYNGDEINCQEIDPDF